MVKLPTDKRDALLAFLGLPLLLFVSTWVLAGCYYETNDDQIITLMLRGVSIRPALTDLSIYFFGFSQLLAGLYDILPAWPWYGLLLYSGLLLATGLANWLLLRNFSLLKPWHRWALLTAFYVFCWLEHVMWFNYMRVPLLLAGTSFLFFVRCQSPARRFRWGPALLSGGFFLSALCIRPSAALLGLLVVAPAAGLLPPATAGRRQAWYPLLFFGLLAGGFLLWLQVHQSPAARQYQRLDLWKSAVLDYGIYEPQLHTPADSLAYAAIGHWLLADSQVINDGFFRRQGQVHAAYVLKQAPQKGRELLEALGRDQFFILLLAAGLLACRRQAPQPARKRLLAYGAYAALLLLAIGLLLKLPPRVLSPCLSLFVLVLLLAIPWPLIRLPARRVALLLLALAGLAYLAKVGHRARVQRQRQQAHEQVLAEVARISRGRTLVYSALPDYYRSLSPFRNYDLGAKVLIPLTGWSTADPAYRHFYRRQTGQHTFAGTVRVLARQPTTRWLLEPEFAVFLSRYLQVLHGVSLGLQEKAGFPHYPDLGVYAPVAK